MHGHRGRSTPLVWISAVALAVVAQVASATRLPQERVSWVAFGLLIAGLSLAGLLRARGGPAVALLIAAGCAYIGLLTDWRIHRRHRPPPETTAGPARSPD
jgi:hypothetical protein